MSGSCAGVRPDLAPFVDVAVDVEESERVGAELADRRGALAARVRGEPGVLFEVFFGVAEEPAGQGAAAGDVFPFVLGRQAKAAAGDRNRAEAARRRVPPLPRFG